MPLGRHAIIGYIDKLDKNDDGTYSLVDYKTDQLSIEALVAQYGEQVRQYARQWAVLTRDGVAYAGLYSVRHGELSSNLL